MKPEAQFIQSVHRYLPRDVYREGMANPYRGGTPDNYYENKQVLWVEYKHTKVLSPIITLTDLSKKPNVSKLQQDWLNRCYNNGHQVAVILGFPEGGYIFNGTEWNIPISREVVLERVCSRSEIARWIAYKVGLDPSLIHRLGNCERFV